jgi:hypothetical protein
MNVLRQKHDCTWNGYVWKGRETKSLVTLDAQEDGNVMEDFYDAPVSKRDKGYPTRKQLGGSTNR